MLGLVTIQRSGTGAEAPVPVMRYIDYLALA